MKKIKISANEENQRIDKFLIKYFKKANSSFVYKMLRKKNFILNEKKSIGSEILKTGDIITVFLSDDTYEKMTGCGNKGVLDEYYAGQSDIDLIDIIYEDDQIIIVNKPVNMLSQRDGTNEVSVNDILLYYTLKNDLKNLDYRAFTPSVCNRLDRNTSGLVIFAKTFIAARTIGDLIKQKKLRKFYLTVVYGELKGKNKLTGIIKKDKINNFVSYRNIDVVDEHKYENVVSLEYKSLRNDKKSSLLEIELFTGKSHQIRVQLAADNHFIIGDNKYGNRAVNRELKVKTQLLCAYKIMFPKIENEKLKHLSHKIFEIKPPEDFDRFY